MRIYSFSQLMCFHKVDFHFIFVEVRYYTMYNSNMEFWIKMFWTLPFVVIGGVQKRPDLLLDYLNCLFTVVILLFLFCDEQNYVDFPINVTKLENQMPKTLKICLKKKRTTKEQNLKTFVDLSIAVRFSRLTENR